MKKLLLAIAIILAVPTSALASQSFDARSFAMGGIGTSTADYLTAPLHNPALAARYAESDGVGFLFPSLGASLYDDGDIIDGIDDMSDALDRLDANLTDANAQDVLNRLRDLQGKTASAQIGTAIAVSVPGEALSFNIFMHSYIDATVYSDVVAADLDIGNLTTQNYAFQSLGAATGVGVMEFGVALAKSYEFTRGTLYYGVTPKIQYVKTINYAANMSNYDFDDYNDYTESKTGVNLDLGVAYAIDGFTFGLVGKNLISQDYDVKEILGVDSTYSLNPVVTASASYRTQLFTFGVDVELNETERFENIRGFTNDIDSDFDNTQLAGFGVEYKVWEFVQLRAGYQTDLANTLDDQFTAGVGFRPVEMFSFDIAGAYGGSNQFGGSFQASFFF